ncbi:MAG: BspA family leucine-rich repeat surface protein [Blautia sp.]|nr:BspA family leucine-rich repeat surface protein [Lachnoclostridium sp.]MCM1209970.1 BspA family leucine-rich repeat surface protein [Blautia sp.]
MVTSADDIASGTSNEISWVIDADGKLTVAGTGDWERQEDKYAPWYEYRTSIKSATVSVTGTTDASYMFYECEALTAVDLSGFNTANVTDMSNMFYECWRLTTLDVSKFNTVNVTNMSDMFSGCYNLTTLDVSKFDTAQVTDMSGMFAGCSNLDTLNVSKFETAKVTNMRDMFASCCSLDTLNVSKFDTAQVTDMSGMFLNCYNLKKLDLSSFNTAQVTDMSRMFYGLHWSLTTLDVSKFDTAQVTDMSGMFSECLSLTSLDVSTFNTAQVTDMSSMFSFCDGLTTLDLSNFNTANVTDMHDMFWKCPDLETVNLSSFDTGKVTDMSAMFEQCGSLDTLDLSHFNTANVTDMSRMFAFCYYLEPLDISHFNTAKVTDMSEMFVQCYNLITLDVSSFDTSSVTDMGSMFYGCSSLTKLDVSHFHTANVTNMSAMFQGCSKLTKLDVSNFDTSNVTGMNYMFKGCAGLTSLDVSNFDTSKVTGMGDMFCVCSGLTTLDVSNFNTANVRDMGGMFSFCYDLTRLDLSRFNTANVTSMKGMFQQCTSLTKLDVSNFDTANVTNMEGMFQQCTSLTKLDLSHFNTANVTNMKDMFFGCTSLSTLNLSNFDTSGVTNMTSMFQQCTSLTKLDLSRFDTAKVTGMIYMFHTCSSLTTLDLSSFDMGKCNSTYRALFGCYNLTAINTPRNVSRSVELPVNSGDIWYRFDGTEVTELPQNLSYSILITKNKKPEVSEPHITAVKQRTAYVCGDTVNTDDITVTYFDDKGTITKLTEGFTTNVDEVNQTMSTPGNKTLIVTYLDSSVSPGREFTAGIELTVTLGLTGENTVMTLPDIETGNYPVYNGRQHTPRVEVKLAQAGMVLDAGTDYTVSYKNNINAGTAAVIVTGMGIYSGTLEKTFPIEKAKVKIKTKDTTIAVGDAIPETFACEMTGFFNGDEKKVTGLSFSFAAPDGASVNKDDIDTSITGTYIVTPITATVGDNYIVDNENGYQPGIFIIAEERIVYTVTFDMMGHGTGNVTAPAPMKSVLSGQLIPEPAAPISEGCLFTGWYKDVACTKAWNFAADTVQADTTLYARWVVQTAEGGIQIQEISEQFYTGNAIKPVPAVYASDGTLLKAGKDYTVKYGNNINADQVAADGGTYNSLDGSAQAAQESGFNAKLPYVEIKGKGNHTGTVYTNFHIRQTAISDAGGNAAAGFTLKYTDQLATNAKKVQKPFSSLKYKKAMTAGKDYMVTYSSDNVLDADGNVVKAGDSGKWTVTGTYDKNNKYTLPAIPKGYSGVFEMTVEGIGNYEGEIKREIFVTNKANLIKNVTVTLGKNQKSMPYNEGSAVTLTPGYSDGKKYYKVSADGSVNSTPEANAKDLFTVKSGKIFLVWGQDYTLNYTNNRAVGTATMTITGIGNYKGSKSVTFKITGAAFKANTVEVKAYNAQTNPNDNDFKASMPYSGSAVTQNKVTLTTKKTNTNPGGKTLRYGEHYTISYKNNIKKGTATMTFTAKPESGYSGSFKKTFKIVTASLADPAFVKVEAAEITGQEQDSLISGKDDKGNIFYKLNGTVTYKREGAKPSQRIRLTLCDGKGNPTNIVLKEGTDYTVSYANNTVLKSANLANKVPTMTFKGKGNYAGNLKVTFDISEAAMEAGADNLTVSAAAAAYSSKKAPEYQYAPKVTVKDGKKALRLNKDFKVEYQNCSQQAIGDYLEALGKNAAWDTVQAKRPYAVITAVNGSGYTTGTDKGIKRYLDIYQTKLTGSNLYIIVSEGENLNIYNGQQVKPSRVTVYYSADTKAVAAARKAKETDEDKLTSASGTYKLTKLTPQSEVDGAGDYTLTYGANVTAGKNKGSVTVTGTGIYGGSVTIKFRILQRDVYTAP